MKRIICIPFLLALILSLTSCTLHGLNQKTEIIYDNEKPDGASVYLTVDFIDYTLEYPVFNLIWHNESKYNLFFGESYSVEKLVGGEYVSVAVKDKAFGEIGITVNSYSTHQKKYPTDWVNISKVGSYRIRSSYILQRDLEGYQSEDACLYFEVVPTD